MFEWVTSVGTVVRRIVTRLLKGTGFFCTGLVIGTFRSVSIDLISPSGYWTPTKYWLPPTGSIQKFFLLNWIDELNAATTFFMTSSWLRPRSAALARLTSMNSSG